MIKYIDGNILNSKADVIFHQVNCQGVMGAGLAKQIIEWCPRHYEDYFAACNQSSPEKLLGNSVSTRYDSTRIVCSIFGQLYYGRGGKCYTDYDAVKNALSKMKNDINDLHWQYPNCRFAVPYQMSCGLAGGDWNKITEILTELFGDTSQDKCKITLEIWKYNGDKVLIPSDEMMRKEYGQEGYDLVFKEKGKY